MAGPATMTLCFSSVRQRLQALRAWPAHRWSLAASAAFVAGLVLGVQPGSSNAVLYRMTSVLWWDYPVLAASAVLLGLMAATYLQPPLP